MNSLQKNVKNHLENLTTKKEQELADLICDLGYEYENESIDPLTRNWTEKQKKLIDQITKLGSHGDFAIIWVRLNSANILRTAQRIIINLINRQFPYNMIIFSNLNDDTWDFVNMKAVKEEESEEDKDPQRRQYLRRIRIDQEDGLRTAIERISLLNIPEAGIHHFDLQKQHDKAFDIEELNKEFYTKIALAFTKLVGGKRKVRGHTKEFEPLLKLPSTTNHQKMQEFAVRLIGRLVFCWFLKKKKSGNKSSLIPEEILSKNAVDPNYYHEILEPLFFEALNTPIENRLDEYKTGKWGKIPFLNGGLFEPNQEDYYETDNIIHKSKYINTLVIPDVWFRELFKVFESYNFTIEENTSIDIDLSIDPEILGRIFENLLAEINPETGETARKNTGSYYTPRPIVEYMVDEGLRQYLLQKTEIEEEKINELLDYSIRDHKLSETEKAAVINELDTIKIIDPACGSGAFPMAALQKMLLILQKVDPESIEWLIKQLDRIPDRNVRKKVEEKMMDENWDYIHKLGIIQNCIYGVDIQPIAVEIAKLRFFLSLIVDENVDDEKPNHGLKPLPNLEFKFICANTLIGIPEAEENKNDRDLFADAFFKDFNSSVKNYFNASEPDEKDKLREKIEILIDKKVQEKFDLIQSLNKRITADPKKLKEREQITTSLTRIMSLWDSYKNLFTNEPVKFFDIKYFFPECKDGFDVVIANPPYIQLQKSIDNSTNKKFADLYKEERYSTFKRTGDIYCLFYEKGINLLKNGGHLVYISSNKWMRAGYGDVLREFFARINPKKLLDFGGFKVFESATVDTNIIIIENAENSSKMEAVQFKKDYQRGDSIRNYFERNKVVLDGMTRDVWFIGSKAEISLKDKIETLGKPLKDWDVNIYRGVLTGYNKAFIIDEAKREELIKKDSRSEEIIKPILRGRDIKRYGYYFKGLYLIDSHNGYEDENRNRVDPINIDDYPAIKEHLDQYWDKISIRQDKGKTPYNLRNCAFYTKFKNNRILWKAISLKPAFCYIEETIFNNDKANILTSENNNPKEIKYICGFLNSLIFQFMFSRIGINMGSGYEYKVQYLNEIPIPPITNENYYINVDEIVKLVDQITSAKKVNLKTDTTALEAEIDQLIYKLYDLNKEEIEIIEENI